VCGKKSGDKMGVHFNCNSNYQEIEEILEENFLFWTNLLLLDTLVSLKHDIH
jgi:hypothetical protein